ncbi:tetratricopeptide repeat protein [Luteolibacter luteus]|uniref:Tetratricopeptide repeat protein n=1 Tax=Luteolibacter luteus TaxID=2728835 RepID=A0A858RN30_9BACT|nr:tetratricopeptide repeat protein [Luteolibacter luteus]QJE98417.1 tetratricopeptide repeat protein [Luteolibacter luteus]
MRALVFSALLVPMLLCAHPDPSHTLAELEQHLRETPGDQTLLRQKADLLITTGHPKEAAPVVQQLMQEGPDQEENLLLEARLHLADGKRDEAETKAKDLVSKHPKDAFGWNLLSRIEHDSGDRDAAIEAKLRYLEFSKSPGPTDVMTCATWLRERGKPGDSEAALEVLDRGVARLGCLSGLHYAAIVIELELGHHDSSLRRIDALTARYRPSVDLEMRRTEILEKAGRFEDAAESCDTAVALLEALPSSRKRTPFYKAQFEAVSKRKAENQERAVK